MAIVIFIIAFAALILVHEFGHFIAAKKSGIRVDEFGLGLPPKAASWKPTKSETEYSLNWLPFGGFVRIFGEDYNDTPDTSNPEYKKSFVAKSKLTQIGVLGAGVFFNVLFAWVLISLNLMMGTLTPVTVENQHLVEDPALVLTQVFPDTPAGDAELQAGDRIVALSSSEGEASGVIDVDRAQSLIAGSNGEVTLTYVRAGEEETVTVLPEGGIVEGVPAIGVSFEVLGWHSLPVHTALWEGVQNTWQLTGNIAKELSLFIGGAFTGSADLSQVVGPIGIAGVYGEAQALGIGYILFFTALISIHLAIINLLPFPALDGGRILFVIIEALKGSPIKPKVVHVTNTVGFALLILLMVVVTYNDIARLIVG